MAHPLQLVVQKVLPEMREVLPILAAVNEFNDFCNKSTTEPLLSRIGLAVGALKISAATLRASASRKVQAIGTSFEASIATRFDDWMKSDVVIASTFLDPYVAYTMPKDDFVKGSDLVKALMVAPISAASDDDDMFTAAGAGPATSPIDAEVKAYLEKVRALKGNPPTKLPSSLSWWEANGKGLPMMLRVYMNLGSIMICSTPSEAVFNQLALTVNDRRGSLADNRASALTLSAAVAKLDRDKLIQPISSMAGDEDSLESIMEELEAQKSGVLSAKYVDLVAHEYDDDVVY
jgi:hypothetical protein